MKRNSIKKKVISVAVMGMIAAAAFMPMKVLAQSDEMVEDIVSETEEKEVEEYGPLTPDGNLTLVDDYGSVALGGKQFITVVTKNQNYFYIIIDRDDRGEETVHFLNAVDESDLLKIMDDEEAQEYIESITETKEIEPEVVEEVPEVTQVEEEKSPTGILAGIFIMTVGGLGGYVYYKYFYDNNTKKMNVDQDADYVEEEEDYLATLEEGEEY